MDNTIYNTNIVKVRKRKVYVASVAKGASCGAIILSRLEPFRKAMTIGLSRRGINVASLDLKTLTVLYYNEFSGRKPLGLSEFINSFCFKITPKDVTVANKNDPRNVTAISDINEVADSIIFVFKNAKERYNTLLIQGFEPRKLMSDESIIQANAAREVQAKLISRAAGDHFVRFSDITPFIKWFFICFVIYYLFIAK